MGLTYTGERNRFATLVNNANDSATKTLATDMINNQRRIILSKKRWWFLEKSFSATTQASTQFIPIAGHIERLISDPYVTIGSQRYTPKEAPSRQFWDQLNFTSYTADIPELWFLFAGQLGFYPTPATAGYTISLIGRQKVIDLSIADYTTGTISTVATSGTTTTITGAGGATWHAGMIGRWIKITAADAANSGDEVWYEIATVPTSSTLTLQRPYGGTAITAGSASYTIGQMSILPEAYHELPLYRALNIYFTSIDPDADKAALYGGLAKELQDTMNAEQSQRSGVVIDNGDMEDGRINPNLTIRA